MKQGVVHPLYVTFDNVTISNVSECKFYFKAIADKNAPTVKTATYKSDGTGDCTLESGKIKIPFTRAETYKFNTTFYLDCRLTVSGEEKEVPITALSMANTIIGEGE